MNGKEMDEVAEDAATIEKVKEAFISALGVPAETDFGQLTYGGIEAWDSVAHMLLIAALESKFGIMIDTPDVIAMSSFAEAVRIVNENASR